MAAVPARMRADHAILKRQKQELIHEKNLADEADKFKVHQKGTWENHMAGVIRSNCVKGKAAAYEARYKQDLQQRRQKLAEKLSAEQKAYEQEMVDGEEKPQQRKEKMAKRAYELKERRENQRKAVVQEKLYQQWRAGIDDLRTMDTEIVHLKVIAERDFQLDEKAARKEEEKAHADFYDKLWQEGYAAKVEREMREKEMKAERGKEQIATLEVQLSMKQEKTKQEKAQLGLEAGEMKKLWHAQEEEEKEALVQEKIVARQERKKADEFMVIQQAQRAEDARLEQEFDRNFVDGVLEKERKLAAQEEAEKNKAKSKAIEFTEALKIEMARKAESDEKLIKLQQEESERQWAKRYAQWEKEELARRSLMEEVYGDRAKQVEHKDEMRNNLRSELSRERGNVDAEVRRLQALEKERMEGEALVEKRHQEELFRQMDFHQVQRHRQLQQHAIEQRQAAIAEEKIRRAVETEKKKSKEIVSEVMRKRATQRSGHTVTAPWDKA